jgi:hypothetical protein
MILFLDTIKTALFFFLVPDASHRVKTGFMNHSKEIIVPAVYDYIYSSHNFLLVERNKKSGLLRMNGSIQLEEKYDGLFFLNKNDPYLFALIGDYYGIIDTSGRVIIDFLYGYLQAIPGGRFLATQKEKWGVVDSTGRTLIDLRYDAMTYHPQTGLFFVKEKKRSGLIDINGQLVSEWYEDAGTYFYCGYCPVKKNGKWGYIDLNGKPICDFIYDEVFNFTYEKRARVKVGDNYGFIDTTGRHAVPVHYEDALDFSSGLCAVKKDGKWGYINSNDSTVIPFRYNEAGSFQYSYTITSPVVVSHSYALVKYGRKYGYIIENGNSLTPFKFAKVNHQPGSVHVKMHRFGRWRYYNIFKDAR